MYEVYSRGLLIRNFKVQMSRSYFLIKSVDHGSVGV